MQESLLRWHGYLGDIVDDRLMKKIYILVRLKVHEEVDYNRD